jgi:transcriptional regulator with XRE-family HTH domain
MPALRRLVASALRAASPSLESLAAALGLSTSALRRYRLGNRAPSADTVQRLASQLRRQATKLVRLAEMLERTTTEGGTNA